MNVLRELFRAEPGTLVLLFLTIALQLWFIRNNQDRLMSILKIGVLIVFAFGTPLGWGIAGLGALLAIGIAFARRKNSARFLDLTLTVLMGCVRGYYMTLDGWP